MTVGVLEFDDDCFQCPPSLRPCSLSFGTIINNHRREKKKKERKGKKKKSLLKSITENSAVMGRKNEDDGNVSRPAHIAVISSARLIRPRLSTLLSDPSGWSVPPGHTRIWKSSSRHTGLVDHAAEE